MNPSSHHPRLRENFREWRPHRPDAGRGFVCILDLRHERRKVESHPTDRFMVWAVLLALVMVFTGMRIPARPAPPLHLDADALRLAAWKSPTGFLLADDFLTTQPDWP